jgi:hypothetical protein
MQTDIICDIIKYGLFKDKGNLVKSTEAIYADLAATQHHVLAKRIGAVLQAYNRRLEKEKGEGKK